jgi:hypothetical protein
MQTEYTNNDFEIAGFFASMRARDLKRDVPEFPVRKKTNTMVLWTVVSGLAASLLLGLFLINHQNHEEILLRDQIVFYLFEDTHHSTTYFEISAESSMDAWEPATQFLLEEH